MKKVLAIAPYSYLPYSSGGQKFIALFLEHLGKETDLTVISVAKNDFTLAKSYKTIPLLKKSFSRYVDITLPAKIITLVKKEKYDFVIWEHPYYAWVANRVKKQTGITTIIHTHNIEHQRFKTLGKWWWGILKTYEKWFFKFADYLFFITTTDKQFAIDQWHIPAEKCIDVPFGIEIGEYPKDKGQCRQLIKSRHVIGEDETIILFNGVLDYKPNLDALMVIVQQINPLLLLHSGFKYKILICGKSLPADLNELNDYKDKNIIYAGFVDDIDVYFKGADLFLNPVNSGGGIKTKMVEAIGFGTTVIATKNGARGIERGFCEKNLIVVDDNDWKGFAEAVIKYSRVVEVTAPGYYEYYHWTNIIRNVCRNLANHTPR